MKITFIKSPTGAYGLAYSIGESADLGKEMNNEMMEAGFAKPATEDQETATAKPKGKETADDKSAKNTATAKPKGKETR